MSATTQIGFRVDEKTYLKAKEILAPNGGVSKYLKEEARKFVKHEISLNPYIVKSSSKSKRISIKIDDDLYTALTKRSVQFDGVSGILRAILMKLIKNEALKSEDKLTK